MICCLPCCHLICLKRKHNDQLFNLLTLDTFQQISHISVACLIATWYVSKDLTIISCLSYCYLTFFKRYDTDQLFAVLPLDVSTDMTLISCLPYCHLKYFKYITLISCLPECHWICFKKILYDNDQLFALLPLDMFTQIWHWLVACLIVTWSIYKYITLISSLL